jgi:uncharacterized protein (TIGR02246 family)
MTTTITTDEQAVRDVLEHIYVTWAANDADAFAALYVDDATVVMPGVFHRGRSAVRDYMAAGFAGPLKGSRGVDEPQDIRIVGGDVAIVVSEGGIVMAGEQTLARRVRATWVLSKLDGEWKIEAYVNTSVG